MDLITLDFETFYDKQYSLSKMTTEEYIHDERFEAIGVGIKFNRHPAHWFSGDMIEPALRKVPWDKVALVAHNARFDASILAWRYGIKPAFIIDTMSMARPFHNSNVGCSLAKLSAHYELGAKGHEVVQALGKRLKDFTPEELAQYGEYCKNDCDLEFGLLEKLVDRLPRPEIMLIDLTLRMYTQPVLRLDTETVQQEIDLELQRKSELMAMVDQPKGVFSSNDKFADFLRTLGVEPPTKPSPKKKQADGVTPVQVYAFAKGDADFIAMLDHDDPLVAAAIEVRLGVKSTQRETRAARFMGVAERNDSYLPVPLDYYAAHTGRFGGCLVADTVIFCFDPLLNAAVEKRIIDVMPDDLVWDGEEFVQHEGVVFSGYAEVIEWDGVKGTEDHVVFTNSGEVSLRDAMQKNLSITTCRCPSGDDVDTARADVGIDQA